MASKEIPQSLHHQVQIAILSKYQSAILSSIEICHPERSEVEGPAFYGSHRFHRSGPWNPWLLFIYALHGRSDSFYSIPRRIEPTTPPTTPPCTARPPSPEGMYCCNLCAS